MWKNSGKNWPSTRSQTVMWQQFTVIPMIPAEKFREKFARGPFPGLTAVAVEL